MGLAPGITDLVDARDDAPHIESSEALYLDLLKKCLCASIYDESAWAVVSGERSRLAAEDGDYLQRIAGPFKRALLRALRRRSYLLVWAHPFDAYKREHGLDGPCFGYTLVGRRRLDNVQFCVEDVLAREVPGDLMETGVWRGGTSILMRALLKMHGVEDRVVWCADSFEGMPVPTSTDMQTQGNSAINLSDNEYLTVSLGRVKANFERFGLLDDQVRFLKGWFCDTLPTAPVERIAVLRLDGDLYSSTMDSLNNLYEKVSSGGYVIVDDYNFWAPCKRAIDEYRQTHGITAELIAIDPHAVYWRVP